MTICTIVQTTFRGFAILDIELTRNNDFYNGQKRREWLRPDSSEKSFFETCFRSLNYFVSKSAIRYREKKNDTIKIGRDFYVMQSIVTISIVLLANLLSLSFEINIEYDVPLTDVKLFPWSFSFQRRYLVFL